MEAEKAVAAEEVPKNGEAAATENGANDEKSPAVSPAVESKEIIAPAASAEPAAAVAAVLNGTSEPAKDEKPIAEVKPVVEEKKVEPVAAPAAPVAEEPKVAEPVSAPAITEATLVDALKEKCTIDVVSPAKIEENGFGENHAAETSATESLNGHDHKTIENIKTDCSDKIISEPTTELAVAGTVQVAE